MRSPQPLPQKLLDELLTLNAKRPLQARQRLVELVLAATPFDCVACFSPRRDQERLCYGGLATVGHPAFAAVAERLEGAPMMATPTMDLQRPASGHRNRFVSVAFEPGAAPEVQAKVFEPLGVFRTERAILYAEDACVGWIGLFRDDAHRTPSEEELRVLAPLVEPLTAVFQATMAGSESEFGVFTPEGRLEWATPDAAPLLADPMVGERMAYAVRRLDRGEVEWARVDLGVRSARLVRMDGERLRYHAHFRPLQPPRIAPDAALTPTQREVASFAVAGATNRQIAQAMEISPETVKDHIKEAYRRLEVSTRVELANALRGGAG